VICAIVIIIVVVVVVLVIIRNGNKKQMTITPLEAVGVQMSKKPDTEEKAPKPEVQVEKPVVASTVDPVVQAPTPTPTPVSLKSFAPQQNKDKPITLGQRVKINGFQHGVVKYIGELEAMPMAGVVYIGVKLDQPEGSGDGSINGVRYFDCDPYCSVFTTPQFVEADE